MISPRADRARLEVPAFNIARGEIERLTWIPLEVWRPRLVNTGFPTTFSASLVEKDLAGLRAMFDITVVGVESSLFTIDNRKIYCIINNLEIV